MKKVLILMLTIVMVIGVTGCGIDPSAETLDKQNQAAVTQTLLTNQPTPTDFNYSLERYNLIKRAYWVNGQRDQANAVVRPIANMPLGYIVTFTANGAVVGKYEVDGKVSSLNSYLTPEAEYYEYSAGSSSQTNKWIPDVDGSYGENDKGIFFFTPQGNYIETTLDYQYSDIPFHVEDPVLKYQEVEEQKDAE